MNVHAIVTVLNERELLNATLRALYDYVSVITVVSAVDRDWKGRKVSPDGGVVDLLRREADPDRKIRVVVLDETNQARVYNRIMDAEMTGAQRPVQQQHEFDAPISAPEYFMLVDADELWEPGSIARSFSFLATERPPYLQIPAWHYFGTWNYRIPDLEWFTVFVRSDRRVYHMRNPDLTRPWTKALFRAPLVSVDLALRSVGVHRMASDVAAFHHGSYVGPRERISAKVAWSPHAHQMRPNWLDSVWSAVTASSTNLHPTDPQAFSRVEYLPHDALPSCIRAIDWPPGYLDD